VAPCVRLSLTSFPPVCLLAIFLYDFNHVIKNLKGTLTRKVDAVTSQLLSKGITFETYDWLGLQFLKLLLNLTKLVCELPSTNFSYENVPLSGQHFFI
jgi:hypothetical protein